MRVLKPSRLRQFWTANPKAEKELRAWLSLVEQASWKSPADVKQTFGVRADFVKVASGNTVVVFDVANNNYRLIAAVHYDHPRVFVLRLFDHAEYDLNRWKAEL